jgi:hypothetical protein
MEVFEFLFIIIIIIIIIFYDQIFKTKQHTYSLIFFY